MPPNKIEDQFLEETKGLDNMHAPLTPNPETGEGEPPKVEEDVEGEDDDSVKNRRHRRLEKALADERASNAFMAGRLAAISESSKFRESADVSEYVKSVDRIYGTQSPEAIEATNLLATALKGVEERATTRAMEMFREEQAKAREEVQKEEENLESMVDEIEDTYGVTLNSATEKGFFRLLEKMSPKDSEGNVTEYADPHAVWEVYSDRLSKNKDTRQKDLASRGMSQGGSGQDSKLNDDAMARYLKEAGIL